MRIHTGCSFFGVMAIAFMTAIPAPVRAATADQANVPGLDSSGPSAPVFTVFTRPVSRPLPSIRHGVQQNGDADVPIEFGPSKIALDATASITNERALRLADLPVLSVRGRSVKLRLTMVGTPLPPFATSAGPNPKDEHALGQALATIRVDVLVVPRPD